MSIELTIVITSLLYMVVNAGICSIMFSKITQLNRPRSFFVQFFWFSLLSTIIIFFLQAFYSTYYCRIQNFFKQAFNVVPPDQRIFHMCSYLTHKSPELISTFFCGSVLLQYFMIQASYITPNLLTLGMLVISNIIACGFKYGLLIIFENNDMY